VGISFFKIPKNPDSCRSHVETVTEKKPDLIFLSPVVSDEKGVLPNSELGRNH
jgi:hypothetical protein